MGEIKVKLRKIRLLEYNLEEIIGLKGWKWLYSDEDQ